jgi:hypothetical protein
VWPIPFGLLFLSAVAALKPICATIRWYLLLRLARHTLDTRGSRGVEALTVLIAAITKTQSPPGQRPSVRRSRQNTNEGFAGDASLDL